MGNDKDRECKETAQGLSEQANQSGQTVDGLTHKLGPRGVFRFRTFEEFNKWKDQFGHEKSPQDPT